MDDTASDKPWSGVTVALVLPLNDDMSVDHDGSAEHVSQLVAQGGASAELNGSPGECQTLTAEGRGQAALEAPANGLFVVASSVSDCGAIGSRRYTAPGADAGAQAQMALPSTIYRAAKLNVTEHFREIAQAGLSDSECGNPIGTKVDLKHAETPTSLTSASSWRSKNPPSTCTVATQSPNWRQNPTR